VKGTGLTDVWVRTKEGEGKGIFKDRVPSTGRLRGKRGQVRKECSIQKNNQRGKNGNYELPREGNFGTTIGSGPRLADGRYGQGKDGKSPLYLEKTGGRKKGTWTES